ncbi:MAG: pyridoxine 5'-phosphate synthase [bacterium]
MARLGVNIDHIANIRQARLAKEPDPIAAAVIVQMAGADGLTIHLRHDRRHIQDRDVRLLKEVIQIPLNLEMAGTDEMVKIAVTERPDMVTLVPEKPNEVTTEGGLDVIANQKNLQDIISALKGEGIRCSIFIDPDQTQVEMAKNLDADCIELHTGIYAAALEAEKIETELKRIAAAAKLADRLGMVVNAGHDLTYRNVASIVAIEEITELNIGHNIIARAVFVGLEQAVKEMLYLVN